MKLHFISFAIRAEEDAPVDEMIEQFCYQQGWEVIDARKFYDDDDEEDDEDE